MKKFLLFSLLALTACSEPDVAKISPSKLKEDALILDVRTPKEHQKISLLQKHWFVPLNKLDAAEFIREYKLNDETPLYILCESGKRAAVAAEKFKKAGLKNVFVIEGGIAAAEKAGLYIRKE